MDDDEVPSIKELTKLRVVDLKQRLTSLGISTSGLKAELVKRLHEALMDQENQESTFGDVKKEEPSEEYNPPEILDQEPQEAPPEDPLEKEKELFEHQKEALAFEQVRLLEEEKARQDVERIELGKQQQQMLVDHEQQQQLMAETQQQLLSQQEVEMIEKGKQQQQILLEMKQNEELAREHRERLLVETQQRMLEQQQQEEIILKQEQIILKQEQLEEQLIQQQQIEERQAFVQPPILAVPVPVHSLGQSQANVVQVSIAGNFPAIISTANNIVQAAEGQIVSVPIQPSMTANIAAATQVARRIPHSGPQAMIIPLNPVMTSSGLSQPVTTVAASYLRSSQPSIVVGPNMDNPQVSLVHTIKSEPVLQVPVIQQQMISAPCTITTMSSTMSVPMTVSNITQGPLVSIPITMSTQGPTQMEHRMNQPPPQMNPSHSAPLMPTPPGPPLIPRSMPEPINNNPPLIQHQFEDMSNRVNVASQPDNAPLLPTPTMEQPKLMMNQQPLLPNQQPLLPNQQPLLPNQQPLLPNQQPLLPNQQPLLPNQQPLLPNQQPLLPNQQPLLPNQQPLLSNQPPLLPNQPPLLPSQPPLLPSQPPLLPNQPPLLPNQQPLLPNQPPLLPNQQPLLPNQQPLLPNQQPLLPNQQPLLPNQQPLLPNQPSLIQNQQPLIANVPMNNISNNNNAPLLPMPPPMRNNDMMPPPPPPQMMMIPQQSQEDFDGPLLPIPVDMQGNEIPPNTMAYGGGNQLKKDKESTEQGSTQSGEYHLPSAIEKVLALKNVRAQEVGMNADGEMEDKIKEEEEKRKKAKEAAPPKVIKPLVAVDEDEDEGDEEDQAPAELTAPVSKLPKESKNKRKKMKKKRARQRKMEQRSANDSNEKEVEQEKDPDDNTEVEIDYVPDTMEPKDPLYFQFLRIFEKFKLQEPEKPKPELTEEQQKELQRQEEIMNRLAERKKPADIDEKDDDDDDRKEEEKPKLSKRKLKKLSRMTVAELKQRVSRPELVEMHDVTAKDPVLLLHLKAARNSVPVPRHWCFKRKYLQGKRGIEKPPFLLPDFIRKTGIMEMRQALQEKEEAKTMKAKMRERVRPKMGKIDIDYQKLHDAFFKWQIKPKMTIHGDLYYEGKEFETRLKEKKPGDLSEELRIALGMPTGPNQNKCPPPWLIAMQRYGPPPSYPNLKIPGLNAPIPDGCSFGYHAGGWGKPPVDEMGRPLYGDVFNTQSGDPNYSMIDEEVDRTLWGELESESSESEEEESEEEEEEEEKPDETGLVTPAEGLVTPSGLSSVPAGMETPDMIELRKRKIESEMEGGETPSLYTVLPERQPERIGASMMGSTHIYDVSAAMPSAKARGVTGAIAGLMPPQGVEVTLDPSELEMDSAAMAARYEQTVREQQSQLAKEDLSDMVAEHAARQKSKRKKQQQQDTGKTAKKYKEFKF